MSALGSEGVREFVRYFAASAVALVVDALLLYVLTSIVGVPYLYSGAIAFLLGLVIVYVLSIVWVFEHRTSVHPGVEFLVFALIGLVGLGVNEGVLYVLTGIYGVYYLVSKIASVVVVFTWNFFARKYMLFRA
jgi:putative flippase GtrA